jgi:hypothetical protein
VEFKIPFLCTHKRTCSYFGLDDAKEDTEVDERILFPSKHFCYKGDENCKSAVGRQKI